MGDSTFVPCREAVLFSKVKNVLKSSSQRVLNQRFYCCNRHKLRCVEYLER